MQTGAYKIIKKPEAADSRIQNIAQKPSSD